MSNRINTTATVRKTLQVGRREATLTCTCSRALAERVQAMAQSEERTPSTMVQVLLIEALAGRARRAVRKQREAVGR